MTDRELLIKTDECLRGAIQDILALDPCDARTARIANNLERKRRQIAEQIGEEQPEARPFSAARLRREPELLVGERLCASCEELPVRKTDRYCKPCLDEAERELKELGY